MENNLVTDITYADHYMVVQANELLRASQESMTALEAKLIRLAIAQIKIDDTDLLTYGCNIFDLAQYLGVSNGSIYHRIDEITTKLQKRIIRLPKNKIDRHGNQSYKKLNWVISSEYDDGQLTIRLHPDIKPYVLGLKAYFAEYDYASIKHLPTFHSVRLFELLSSWANTITRGDYHPANPPRPLRPDEYWSTIDELRKIFDCESKYKLTNDFLRYVVDPAIKAINDNTVVMGVSRELIREKRRVKHVIFRIKDWSAK